MQSILSDITVILWRESEFRFDNEFDDNNVDLLLNVKVGIWNELMARNIVKVSSRTN